MTAAPGAADDHTGIQTSDRFGGPHLGRPRYPRIAALAFSAAAVIAVFAGFAPETTSFTPIMNASRMSLDCGWKRIAFARSTSAFCRLVSAAAAACGPNAFL